MGLASLPLYGNVDLGSAIETAEKVIAKIKTNKFDNDDVKELKDALTEIVTAIENED